MGTMVDFWRVRMKEELWALGVLQIIEPLLRH